MSCVRVHAESKTTYLIYGDMPNYILIEQMEDDQLRVLSLPSTLILQAACTSKSVAINTLASPTTLSCLKETIETSFAKTIDHTIYLNTEMIDQDFPQHLKGADLINMDCMISYFNSLRNQLDISILWNYQSYIQTDLSLWELKDLFPIFTAQQPSIQYRYLHLLGSEQYWYALDKKIYKVG